ncbi:hypothetical protein [Catellatospora sichuanensis]|uniref:hypothetical protein n=1 Tax=Catellatospora sichuanensis TaxID=1969805 RepID=UPI0011827839|nr:hypothetical protein [Catellatospora sichuanensis]
MNMDEIVDLLPLIAHVSRDVHYAYGIEEEEAYGLLALEVVERSRDYLILWREGQSGLIETRLKNVAAVHARADRVKRVNESDQYFYDPEYVRLFLPFFFDREDWDNGPAPEDASTKWTTGEARDTALDIKRAWGRLKEWQARIIEERHLGKPSEDGGPDWDAISEVTGRTGAQSARTGYARATRELSMEMNTARTDRTKGHEGPGARQALSNAQANAVISNT